MGRALTGTVIITGGCEGLSADIAVAIAQTHPFVHLLLTGRNVQVDDVQGLKNRIRVIGSRSIEFISLDPIDAESVTNFAEKTVYRVRAGEIPPIGALIYTDALVSYTVDELTLDGFDPVYQTNSITPFFLTVGLLEAFRGSDGKSEGGARVILMGSSAAISGRLDYFDHQQGRDQRPPGTSLSTREAQARFASSKLIGSVAMYALRRSLANTGSISLDILTLDPGNTAGKGSRRSPMSIRAGLGPILRMVSPQSKKASKVITQVAFQSVETQPRERYMIMGREYEAASVLRPLQDGVQMGVLLGQMLQWSEASSKKIQGTKGRRSTLSPRPTLTWT